MDLTSFAQWSGLILSPIFILILYIRWNDRALTSIPTSAIYFAPKRCTADDVYATAERLANSPPLSKNENLPPRTGRRYIVVGGVRPFRSCTIWTRLIRIAGRIPRRVDCDEALAAGRRTTSHSAAGSDIAHEPRSEERIVKRNGIYQGGYDGRRCSRNGLQGSVARSSKLN